MEYNKNICPDCGSVNILEIVYGLPSPIMFEKAERGEIKLGGCCVVEGVSPDCYCKDCETTWRS